MANVPRGTFQLTVAYFALSLAALAAPRIDSISPTQGPIAGGTDVVVNGAGFTGATVRLDSTTLTPLSQTDTQIRLRTPAHDNGYAVINVRAGTGNAYAEFLYVPPRLADLPPGYITTVAGVGRYVRDFGPATNASISPTGLAFDASGNLYIAENNNDKLARVRPDGIIERVTAPGGADLPLGDGGLAVDAHLAFPLSVGVDVAGNVYIPDHQFRIRKIDARTGIIATIAGDGRAGYSGDNGPAVLARIGVPSHIAADGEDVFFIDFSDGLFSTARTQRIRRIHFADGRITTFAGTGTPGFSGDGGPAALAQFDTGDTDRGDLALDFSGHLFLADTLNYRIRQIDRTTGVITTFYALPRNSAAPDGVGEVRAIACDRSGNLYYAGFGRIVKLSPTATLLKSWGNGTTAFPSDGSLATTAGIGNIEGLAIDASGNIFFSDTSTTRVRRIDIATDRVFTVAGIGPALIGETGPAIAAVIPPPSVGLTVDRDGSLLLAEFGDGRVRRLDRSGTITTFVGTGSGAIGKPPPAFVTEVQTGASGVSVDAYGEIDLSGLAMMHIDRTGFVRVIAGWPGTWGYRGDGGPATGTSPATSALLCQAWDFARDPAGHLFIADTNNNRIRRVDARTGIITTVVGNGGPINGIEGYGLGKSSGDGGPAIDAAINTPYGVAFGPSGNLYIACEAIRKVDAATGRISTFAAIPGTTKLVFDTAGNLYASTGAGVFKVDPAGTRTFLAGKDGTASDMGFAGDGGPASAAKVHISGQAAGLAIDPDGNLYFWDDGRVRAIRGAAPAGPLRFPPLPARLSNISVRTALAANQTLIVGLTTGGGARDLLVRAAGPALASFGLTTAMADPRLDLFNGASALLRSNDNWDASLAGTFTNVGAFAFPAGSQDAALVQTLDGGYTVQARGTGAGIVLVEAYDLGTANSPRLTNASVRNAVGTGANILIAGFNVAGTGPKPLLIRAVGPKLAAFGLSGFLADPKLELYDATNKKLDENDNWSATLAPIFTSVGTFPLDANSKDAALYTVLAPGSYTVQVKGADGGTGEALVEIYEVP